MDRGEAFRVFGLPESASEAQIKAAYWDLAKIWHPDKFTHDPTLRAKAEETLKLINTAYRKLGEDTTRSAQTFFSRGPDDGDPEPVSVRTARRRPAAVKMAPDAFVRKFFVGFFGYSLLFLMVLGSLEELIAASYSWKGIPEGMTPWILVIVIGALAVFGLTWPVYIDEIKIR